MFRPVPSGTVSPGHVTNPDAPLTAEERLERSARIRADSVRQRIALAERLRQEDAHDLAGKLDACGQATSLTCTSCGMQHAIETRCKRRWCPSCARKLSFDRVVKYERRLQTLQWPLWATFTIRNDDSPDVIDRLKAGWKMFRRKKIFTAHTVGGLWALEVTERGNGWHPHIHAMLDCRWLAANTPEPHQLDTRAIIREKMSYAKAELDEEWGACVSQDWASTFVARKSGGDAVRELLKYAVKGSDLLSSTLPIAPLIRMIDAGRTISTFGSLRANKLPPEPDDSRPKLACTYCEAEGAWLPSYCVPFTGGVLGLTVPFKNEQADPDRNPFGR